jgi:hypothetical protein
MVAPVMPQRWRKKKPPGGWRFFQVSSIGAVSGRVQSYRQWLLAVKVKPIAAEVEHHGSA